MKKEDFKKGQEVYVYSYSNYTKVKGRMEKAVVASVGRKYITVDLDRWRSVKFDFTNNFNSASGYMDRYKLYLTLEQKECEDRIKNKCREIFRFFREGSFLCKLSEEDLDTILSVIHKNQE